MICVLCAVNVLCYEPMFEFCVNKKVFAKVACTFCDKCFHRNFLKCRCVQVSSPISLRFNFKLDKMFSWNPLSWFIFAIKRQITDEHKWNSTSLCKTGGCFFIQLKIYEPIFGFAHNGKPFARKNNSLVNSIWIFAQSNCVTIHGCMIFFVGRIAHFVFESFPFSRATFPHNFARSAFLDSIKGCNCWELYYYYYYYILYIKHQSS